MPLTLLNYTKLTVQMRLGYDRLSVRLVQLGQAWFCQVRFVLVILGQVIGFAGYARSGQVSLGKVSLVASVGPDGSISTATRYGLDGPGIESGGQGFPHPSGLALGLTQSSIKWALSHGYRSRDVALTTQPHLVRKLKKQYVYTFAPTLAFMFQGDLYLYFTLGWSVDSGWVTLVQQFVYLFIYFFTNCLLTVPRHSHSHSLLPTRGHSPTSVRPKRSVCFKKRRLM